MINFEILNTIISKKPKPIKAGDLYKIKDGKLIYYFLSDKTYSSIKEENNIIKIVSIALDNSVTGILQVKTFENELIDSIRGYVIVDKESLEPYVYKN